MNSLVFSATKNIDLIVTLFFCGAFWRIWSYGKCGNWKSESSSERILSSTFMIFPILSISSLLIIGIAILQDYDFLFLSISLISVVVGIGLFYPYKFLIRFGSVFSSKIPLISFFALTFSLYGSFMLTSAFGLKPPHVLKNTDDIVYFNENHRTYASRLCVLTGMTSNVYIANFFDYFDVGVKAYKTTKTEKIKIMFGYELPIIYRPDPLCHSIHGLSNSYVRDFTFYSLYLKPYKAIQNYSICKREPWICEAQKEWKHLTTRQ
nr:hypothetical protein [uncultured Cohaesibacter sp.]